MKQRQVADALGVSRSAYTNYEAGARCPDADMLTKMADFFEISVDEILGHTPKQSKDFRLQPRELMLVKKFRALSAAGQTRTLQQMDFELSLEEEHAKPQNCELTRYLSADTANTASIVREKK
jgi:transcriptional regulator with XRE-family HTH domain